MSKILQRRPVMICFLLDCALSRCFCSVAGFLFEHGIPNNSVMFSIELHNLHSGDSQIVFLVSDCPENLSRCESYERCIFSKHVEELGRIVKLDNVRSNLAYFEIDSRVNSEVFCELPVFQDLNLILNAEMSSGEVSARTQEWFRQIVFTVARCFSSKRMHKSLCRGRAGRHLPEHRRREQVGYLRR